VRPAPDLLARRLLFFTGKGGVGKSTVTAATALLAAEQGQRVLVVEADDKGAIPGNFEQPSVGFEPREVYPGVCAMAMRTEDSSSTCVCRCSDGSARWHACSISSRPRRRA
jgi:anion-transporting  ArsA/GET3 family ATPase